MDYKCPKCGDVLDIYLEYDEVTDGQYQYSSHVSCKKCNIYVIESFLRFDHVELFPDEKLKKLTEKAYKSLTDRHSTHQNVSI